MSEINPLHTPAYTADDYGVDTHLAAGEASERLREGNRIYAAVALTERIDEAVGDVRDSCEASVANVEAAVAALRVR